MMDLDLNLYLESRNMKTLEEQPVNSYSYVGSDTKEFKMFGAVSWDGESTLCDNQEVIGKTIWKETLTQSFENDANSADRNEWLKLGSIQASALKAGRMNIISSVQTEILLPNCLTITRSVFIFLFGNAEHIL